MSDPTVGWCLSIGILLILMTLGNAWISRLPLSTAMVYLLVGYGLGPAGLGLIRLEPVRDAALLEHLTEIAVLISLFNAGFKLQLPLMHRSWRVPVQLATLSMLMTVVLLTLAGRMLLGLTLGLALLLAAILAPTDPVLASDVQVAHPQDRDPLRFGLTGEGGLNDGTAFPVLLLALGWLGLRDASHWWWQDVVWAVGGALALGYGLGYGTGRLVLWLRQQHREAVGSDEFISLGLIALAYGLALWWHTYGFLAVFAAGLALCQARRVLPPSDGTSASTPASMYRSLEAINAQLERIAEVIIVLVLGALLVHVPFDPRLPWLLPLLFLLIRPVSVVVGLAGTRTAPRRLVLMSWFGIRGIGSLYYLFHSITHGLSPATATQLTGLVVPVVVASIIAHGISVTPLMLWYEHRRGRDRT